MSDPTNTLPLKPRPAATVIIARDAPQGVEVFMMRRSAQMVFGGGSYVFPGGALDAADHDEQWAELCDGLDEAQASRLMKLERGGLAHWIAAVRECFEESGLLLCRDRRGELVAHGDAGHAAAITKLRAELLAGSVSFAEVVRRLELRLALDGLAYLAHWITPPGQVRRYDTRFLLTALTLRQDASLHGGEADDHLWMSPRMALERHGNGEINLRLPTRETLKFLARFGSTEGLMTHARAQRHVPTHLSRYASGRDGRRALHAGEAAYAEVAKLDPGETGSASYEIIAGVTTRLSPRVRRITAPNPGFMTGPGTNSYLIGAGADIAIIDPGPAIASHIEALLEEARNSGQRIRWLLATHTHNDHSPAAAAIREKTGAELIGRPPPEQGNQDRQFLPTRIPANGERLAIAGCSLRALHVPGHASNQVVYLLEEENMLFTGDHVMQGSTVVISPPDGNMSHYLDSLRAAQALGAEWIAPGHGFLMADPKGAIEGIIRHRLKREAKVLEALGSLGSGTLEELVVKAYDDVPAKVHPVASRSLHAHLLKLQAEGRAVKDGERWSPAGQI